MSTIEHMAQGQLGARYAFRFSPIASGRCSIESETMHTEEVHVLCMLIVQMSVRFAIISLGH